MATVQITPLGQAITRSRLSGQKLDALCAQIGISRGNLLEYAAGKGRPAPWLARAIAEAFDATVEELFPRREVEA